MTTGSVANPNYACGWLLDGSTWSHHPGGLPGAEHAIQIHSVWQFQCGYTHKHTQHRPEF